MRKAEQKHNNEWRGDPDGEQGPEIFKISRKDGPPTGAQAQSCMVTEVEEEVNEFQHTTPPLGRRGRLGPTLVVKREHGDTREE